MNLQSFSLSPYFVPSWIIFGFPEKRVLKSPLFQCLIPCFKNIGMGSFLVASWPLQIQLMISQVIITTSDKSFSGRIWGQNISLQFMRFGLINSHNDERSGLFVWRRRNQYLASLAWSSFGRGGPVNNSASDAKRKIPRWAWTVEYYWYAKFCCCLNISSSDSSWKDASWANALLYCWYDKFGHEYFPIALFPFKSQIPIHVLFILCVYAGVRFWCLVSRIHGMRISHFISVSLPWGLAYDARLGDKIGRGRDREEAVLN